jgi:hypothetical protein
MMSKGSQCVPLYETPAPTKGKGGGRGEDRDLRGKPSGAKGSSNSAAPVRPSLSMRPCLPTPSFSMFETLTLTSFYCSDAPSTGPSSAPSDSIQPSGVPSTSIQPSGVPSGVPSVSAAPSPVCPPKSVSIPDRTALDTAIDEFIASGTSSVYGDITTWDISMITNLSFLFSNQSTFNADISCW